MRLHPFSTIEPALQVTGTEPQELDAVTLPPNPPEAIAVQDGRFNGLQPRETVLLVQLLKTGVGDAVAVTVKVAWQVVVKGVQVLV